MSNLCCRSSSSASTDGDRAVRCGGRVAAERTRGDGPPADSPPYTPSSLHSWGSGSAGGGEHTLPSLGSRLPDIADAEHQDSCEA